MRRGLVPVPGGATTYASPSEERLVAQHVSCPAISWMAGVRFEVHSELPHASMLGARQPAKFSTGRRLPFSSISVLGTGPPSKLRS
jgi:hypothetical protein